MHTIALIDSLAGYPGPGLPHHLVEPIAGRSIVARTACQAARSAYSCGLFCTVPPDQLPPAGLPATTHIVPACRAEENLTTTALGVLHGIEQHRGLYPRLPVLNGSSIVVMVPGDMPEILGRDLDLMIRWLVRDSKCGVATLCRPATAFDKIDPACRKLVRRNDGVSIRQFCREPSDQQQFRHLDCWAFRIETLRELARVPATTRSQQTGIEATAWLEAGFRILAADTDTDAHHVTAERFGDYRAHERLKSPWSRPHG